MFYVYEWYDVETNLIFYVGKGSNKRYRCKKHNELFKEYLTKHKCDSRIVKYFSNEKDAFIYEKLYIDELKELNQCICNIYSGGYGGDRKSWTDVKRKHYSTHNCMKKPEQRKRMPINNPMKNKDIATKVGIKHRKPFYIGDTLFNTLNEAALKFDVTPQAIVYGLKHGSFKGLPCYRKSK